MRRTLTLICQIILGGIFIWSGLSKVIDPAEFAVYVANFQLLPDWLILPTAYLLPWLELLSGLALVIGLASRGGAFWAVVMLAVFTAALTINSFRGLDVACGCFGSLDAGGTTEALIKNLVLLPFAVVVFWLLNRKQKATMVL